MENKELAKMKRRVKTLQKRMAQLGPVMRGSVVIIGTRNKQSYFSLNRNKRTQLMKQPCANEVTLLAELEPRSVAKRFYKPDEMGVSRLQNHCGRILDWGRIQRL